MSKVDYCNVVLAGLPKPDVNRLQSVIKAAARLTTRARKYDHVIPLLVDLHWLSVPEHITYKKYVLVHNCLQGTVPRYLQDVIQPVTCDLHPRLLRWYQQHVILLSETESLPWLDITLGMTYPTSSLTVHHLPPSKKHLNSEDILVLPGILEHGKTAFLTP